MIIIMCARRSLWWVWTKTLVFPCIVNNVLYVTRISHDSHFACQAQYLVSLDNDTCCSAHCKYDLMFDKGLIVRFIFRDRRSIW